MIEFWRFSACTGLIALILLPRVPGPQVAQTALHRSEVSGGKDDVVWFSWFLEDVLLGYPTMLTRLVRKQTRPPEAQSPGNRMKNDCIHAAIISVA